MSLPRVRYETWRDALCRPQERLDAEAALLPFLGERAELRTDGRLRGDFIYVLDQALARTGSPFRVDNRGRFDGTLKLYKPLATSRNTSAPLTK